MNQPWIKFYPRDWRGDQALRAVSIAARGLWLECLCIMHEAKPYGHLLLNGNPVEGDVLARMTGVPVEEAAALMAELREAGVLSVTSKGVVFSRRMTKDHARACKGRLAAEKRYQNRLTQVSDDVEQSDAPNGLPNGLPMDLPSAQIPEARSQKEKKSEAIASPKEKRGTRLPEGFEPLEIDVQRARGWGLSDDEIRFEHEKFTDYWRSVAGARATKNDWDGTWRNWMRKASDDKRNRQAGKSRREG